MYGLETIIAMNERAAREQAKEADEPRIEDTVMLRRLEKQRDELQEQLQEVRASYERVLGKNVRLVHENSELKDRVGFLAKRLGDETQARICRELVIVALSERLGTIAEVVNA